jgi:hypothetical protein
MDNAGNVVAGQLTNGGGEYSVYVAQPGSYLVRFSDCGAGYTTTQWYYSAPRQEDAQTVQVVSDQMTPNVNGYLQSAGRVTGKLKDNLAAVLTGACVKAEDQNGAQLAETRTDGNGDYVLGGLLPGDVRIRFEGCSAGNYVSEYYDDAATKLDATPVTVETGSTTSGIDAVLQAAGRIAGHVRNVDGEPLESMCVTGWAAGEEVVGAVTDHNGAYEIRGVPPTLGHRPPADPGPGDPAPANPAPVDQGQPAPGGTPPASGDPVASGSSGGDAPLPVVTPAGCKVPKLVGLSLAKARKRLRAAHCTLGKVTRKHSRNHAKKRTVLSARLKRGRVALTVAK